jgi:phosphoribosyl-AMP cyclohydrolase
MEKARDTTDRFEPRFDSAGLVTAIVIDDDTRDLLMVAHMNADAIARTQASGLVHFWSRSRARLWCKGETSGNLLKLVEMLVDCDQDALLLRVRPQGPACHTGRRSCFYRSVGAEGALTFVDSDEQS